MKVYCPQIHGLAGKLNYDDSTLKHLYIVLSHRHSNNQLPKWNQMLLNKEFNVKVIMSVLTQHHKSITLEMRLNPGVTMPMPVTMTIQTAWYMCLSTFKILMLQCHPSGSTMTTFLRSTRSFIVLAKEYLMD